MNIENGLNTWKKAKELIPGGTQLLSKRPEMFLPNQWPAYYKKAKGIEIWDLDGNKYKDMTIMGVGACTLGYADPDVNTAVINMVQNGNMATLNNPEEVELAELLIKIHPWAGGVRYVRTGGEAMSVAVRIARAYAKKDKLAFCGYHGWHDWYLSTNIADSTNLNQHLLSGLAPNGVPKGLAGSSIPFEYNKIEQLEEIISKNDIGVIVVEPYRHEDPKDDFLQKIRRIADEIKAVLVYDEITIAWRLIVGGIHKKFNITPDIAVFAKAMSNGYPMGAILGKKAIMDAAQTSFISSTYWTEGVGPTAAIATINKMQKQNVPQHLDFIGGLIAQGWKKIAEENDINIKILKPNALVTFSFDYPNALELSTLFTQEMLEKGFLATNSVYVSYSHQKSDIDEYLTCVDDAFKKIHTGIENNSIKNMLKGPVKHSGFQRLTR
jgi:glutamate-1-semialdehyde aminotransferase